MCAVETTFLQARSAQTHSRTFEIAGMFDVGSIAE